MNVAVYCVINKTACQGPVPLWFWIFLGAMTVATVGFGVWVSRKF